jgi:hypothetical protein
LCDSAVSDEPLSATFLFYRYGASDDLTSGGILVHPKGGEQKYFDFENIKVTRNDGFGGEQILLPGLTRLLYPDYVPVTPKKIVFSAVDGADKLNIVFTPKAVCSIVMPSLFSKAEVVFNEMYCSASFKGRIGKYTYDKVIPCWFESVRPRRSA